MKTVNVIIKADVQGSVEALAASLLKIDVEGVRVNVVHSAVGAINESDITLAEASDAVVIGFNVRPDATAKATAEREGVDVRLYRVIYDAIADVEAAMKGMLDPIFEEKVIGHAEYVSCSKLPVSEPSPVLMCWTVRSREAALSVLPVKEHRSLKDRWHP